MNTNITEIKNVIVNETINPSPAPAEIPAPSQVAPDNMPAASPSPLSPGPGPKSELGLSTMDSPSEVENSNSSIDAALTDFSKARPPGKRPRNGKIARLPKDLLEWVNYQLFQEAYFGDILDTLDLHGYPDITQQNLTNWKIDGYREWLLDQQTRQEKRERLATLSSVVSENRGRITEAALMVVSSQLLDVVSTQDLTAMKTELAKDPMAYLKIVPLLSKLNNDNQSLRKPGIVSPQLESQPLDLRILPETERSLTDATLNKVNTALTRC